MLLFCFWRALQRMYLDMYCEATERCLYDEQKLDELRTPKEIRDAIRRSWEEVANFVSDVF